MCCRRAAPARQVYSSSSFSVVSIGENAPSVGEYCGEVGDRVGAFSTSDKPTEVGEYCGLVGEYAGEVGLYAGEVGLYAGDVGEYAGDVGEYAGDVGEYAGLVGLYAGDVGLYAGDVGEYAGDVGLYAGDVGLYAGEVGLYAGDVGLYAGDVGEYAGDVGEYAGLVGLYAGLVGLYAGLVGLYAGLVGLYPGDVGENPIPSPPPPPPPPSVYGENRIVSSKGLACACGDNKNDGDADPTPPGVVPLAGVVPAPRASAECVAKLARPERAELPEHDVLGETGHAIALRERGGFHQDVHRLLEGAAHERPGLHAVDPVPGDRHQVPTVRHHLDEDREVAVVDVRAVELDDASEFLQKRVSHRLDAQDLDHLDEVVRRRPREVHVLVVHHLEEVHALGVEHPLRFLRVRLRLRVQAHRVRLADEDFFDIRNPAQRERVEQLRFQTLQEDLVLGLARALLLLELAVHDADPHDELLAVVVVEDARQVVLEVFVDALRDVRHEQLLINHHLAVELDPQHPRRHPRRVHLLVRHLVVRANELLVLLDDRVRGVRVVVNLAHRGDAVKRRVLQARLHVFRHRAVAREVLTQRHRERRRLDLLRDVDDLLQTRDAEGHVLRGYTGEVERVEGHLRRGLADGLRGDGADAIPGGRERHLEPGLDLADDPVERRGGELEVLHDALRAERRSHEREEQDGAVPLRLEG
eukprot:30000-Pelagococcus_subviridis.AAC.2